MKKFKKIENYNIVFILGIVVLFITIIFSTTVGVAKISFFEAIKIVFYQIPYINNLISIEGISETYQLIVWRLRMPRIIMSVIVGSGLSVVGASFQGIFRNPMADPYVLGISSGAALGASLSIVLGLNKIFLGFGMVGISAFVGAIITTIVVYNIARVGSRVPTVTLLLAGIASSFFLSSIISTLMLFNRDRVEQIVFWTMGSVSAANWNQVLMILPVVSVSIGIIVLFARDLDVMVTGEDTARSLGIEVETVKKILLFISTIIVGVCVSVSGIIGFVGLIIPHVVRMIFKPNHRILIPLSVIAGAIFMVICDSLARSLVPPTEIPVGVITSLFGAPYFIYLLFMNKKKVV